MSTKPVKNEEGLVLGYTYTEPGPNSTYLHDGESFQPLPPKHMTTPELFDFARAECNKAIALAMAKNADYATGADPFQNLRRGGLFGIAVRMDDKVSRLLNLVKTGAEPKVLSESVRDTAVDLLNYSWLFLALLEELSRGGR